VEKKGKSQFYEARAVNALSRRESFADQARNDVRFDGGKGLLRNMSAPDPALRRGVPPDQSRLPG